MTRGPDPRDSTALAEIASRYESGDLDGAEAASRALAGAHRERERQLPAIMWLGFIAQARGDVPAARQHFSDARQIDRRNPNLLVQLGALHDQLGEWPEAESCYRDAIRLEPRMAMAHYNLGVVLAARRDFAGARRAYESAVLHQPAFHQAYLNLGNVFLQFDEPASAKECYRQALSINPRFSAAHRALGLLALRHHQPDAARQCFRAAVESDPDHLEAWLDLSDSHQRAGETADALAALDAVLARQPDHETALFKRALISGAQPGAMPAPLVANLFNGLAANFDEHLVERLGYEVPTRMVALLGPWISSKQAMAGRGLAVLDLGCGTGLFGAAIAPDKSRLVGVDLSAEMIVRAEARGVYDDLHAMALLDWLALPGERFDLVAATDVLIYIGALDALAAAVRTRLAPGGRFAFSVESPEELGDGYALLPSGRYAHAPRYVEAIAAQHGLRVDSRQVTTIRTENGVPLPGHLFVLAAA